MKNPNQPAAYHVLEDLQQHIQGPEDEVQLAEWRQEIDTKREEALKNLGNTALPKELHASPQISEKGVVLTPSERAALNNGDTSKYSSH